MIKELLGRIDACTILVPVYIGDEEAVPEIKDLYGVYIGAKNEIVLAHDMEHQLRRFYARHEAMHAVFDHGGLADLIEGTTAEGAEEVFVRTFCPLLARAWDDVERLFT
jgi:hypothetical protein